PIQTNQTVDAYLSEVSRRVGATHLQQCAAPGENRGQRLAVVAAAGGELREVALRPRQEFVLSFALENSDRAVLVLRRGLEVVHVVVRRRERRQDLGFEQVVARFQAFGGGQRALVG